MCYICIYIHIFILFSSPHLLVCGDDRIRGIREQMMLQVDLVRPRDGVGANWEIL